MQMLMLVLFVWMVSLGPPAWAQERYSSATLQSAAVATGNGTVMNVATFTSVGVQVTIATTATVAFEVSQNGSTWSAVACVDPTSTSSALASSTTATGTYQCSVAGMQYFRARISAWTAGAVTVTATATTADLAKGGGGGGGTQYVEDTAHNSGDTGTMALGVRRDANTTLADTTGDYAPFQLDANGNLKVNIIAGGGSGGTSVVEDAAHSGGENITPLGCRRIDTAATSASTSGDWATVDCDANGAVRVRIDSTAVGSVSDDDDNSIAQDTTGHSVVINIPYVNNGTTWERQRKFTYAEDAAHADGDTGVAILSRRIDTLASSAGASADYAAVNTDQLGRLYTRDANPCSDYSRITHAAISESTAATNEIVALNGSDLIYVCSYKWVTTAANSLNWTRGTGTDCATGTTAIEGAQPFAANGGVAESGGGHPLFVVPAGNALCLVSSAATAHGGRVSYVRTAAP